MDLFCKIKNKLIIDEYQFKYSVDSKIEKFYRDVPNNINFYIATLSDINKIRELYKNEFTEYKYNLYKQRINENNKIIIISKIDGEICGYFNISFVDTYESGIDKNIQINETEAYFFDDYVFKKFRGKSIQKMSILYRLDLINDLGKKTAYVNIYSNNKASRISYEKLGFKIIKKYRRNKVTKKKSEQSIK